jgi:SpoIID/LytB domain protein
VTLGRATTRQFERMTRAHALMVTCVCTGILFLGLAAPRGNWPPLDWPSSSNQPDEDALDAALQEAATAALQQREGTIIVMDPQTGRVRAVVNPQIAFAQAFMPGSTMKSFAALAALRAGLIDANSRTVCPGRFHGRNFSLPCVHQDHLPPFTPAQAIAYSCNYYFATLGRGLGRDQLVETLRPFGFGQPTGVISEEVTGKLRPCEIGNSGRIRTSQSDCDARAAIGESDHTQVSPIQLVTAYAALVNGGHLFQPGVQGANEFHALERGTVTIAPEHRSIVIEGMRGAVRYGTAKTAQLASLATYIIGKTGTALPPKGFRSNGWFVGFAASQRQSAPSASEAELDPSEIHLAVLVFLTRSHGVEAAAISKSVFQAYADAEQRDAETRRSGETGKKVGAWPHPPVSASNVRVHLVRDDVTQELSLEDYVLGVMRAEGSMETESEALKALAIAIRTFATNNRGRHSKDGYDFCSTTHCQRFIAHGVSSPTVWEGSARDQALPDGRATDTIFVAVRATEGQVLIDDKGKTADVYFSASCGGETANMSTLWGTNPPAYLRGVRDEFCVSGPHAHWTNVIPRADLLRALQSDARTDVGSRLDNVVVNKRDETGRAEFITIEGEQRKTVRGWDFKIIVGRVLGWNLLKSSRFVVARFGSNFIFRGSGFGHGLGLCQEGAHVMAQGGASYHRILEKYFPGTRVRRDRETPGRGDTVRSSVPRRDDIADSTSWKTDILPNPSPRLRVPVSPRPRVPVSPPPHVAASSRARVLVLSSEHFRVTYPASVDRRDANLVLTTVESARTDFLRRANAASIAISGIPTLEIRLNQSTGDFTSRTGQPWWAAAATKGNRIELPPVAILKRRGVLTTTLRHELAHVVIDLVSHDRAPRWLEEGFAIYLAGEGRMFSPYQRRGALLTEELEKRLARPGSQHEMRALYAQAYTSVLELVRNGSETSVWKKIAGG